MDKKCNVWSVIIRQVQKHSHHQVRVPLYFGRIYISIWPKYFHNISRNGFPITFYHPNLFQQIINQNLFLKLTILIIQPNIFNAW